MNKEINTNQGKLPIKARIGRGKVTNRLKTAHLPNRLKTAHFKNARNKMTGGKAFQMKKSQLKITRTIEGRKGGISVTSRNLIAKDGKIVRIKRNIPLNSGKKLGKPVGRKILQTQNIRNNSRNRLGENSNTVGRKILRTQDIRKNSRNRLEQNLNPSVRKVEFDDQGGLEVEAGQGDFMGNLNYGFEAMPTFPQIQIPLLPTPPVQQRIFPPVLEPFHNNSQNLMNVNMDNLRNLEFQNAQKYEEELRALERKRVEEEIREIERKRMEEMEMKRKQEEMRKMERKREEEMREMERKRMEELMFEEEQKRFEEEQRRYEEEQRMIEEERKNLDYLRKALDMEKRELENLKKTVEEEEEMERRSVSKGREMTNKFVFGLDSNRSKQIGKLNIAQNQKSQDTHSKPSSQRERYDSRVNNSNRKYGKVDFYSSSQKMPDADFLDFMLNKPSGSRGDSERREMGGNSRGRGGGRGKNSNNTRGGRGGGGGNINTSDRGKGRNNNNRGYDQSSKFNDSERSYDTRNSGKLNYMFDTEPSDAPGYSQGGNFNQSDNYYSSDFDDGSRRGEYDNARRGEYDDMSRRGEYYDTSRTGDYDDMTRKGDYDDMTRRGEYDDMTRRGEYDDMTRRGEYDDDNMTRRGEYDDMTSRGEYDDMSRQGEYNNNAEYSFQRGSSREGEVFSNKNSNYDNQTESGYQILSRGFKPLKDDEKKTPYQSTNNFGSYQDSFAGHPYYDDMYDQGRINRNQTGNSGRLGSQEKQGTLRGTSFSSRTEENKFGFVGYPFKNRSPIYEGPRGSERNNSSNQNLVGHTSNSSNQQEKSMDSFYSYRPGDKPTNDSSRSEKSGSGGIDILGGGTSLMTSSPGKSSANFGKNSVNSRYDANFYGKVVQNPNMGSASYSNSRSNPVDNDFGNESQGNIKTLLNKKTKIMSALRKLDPSNEERKETLYKNLNDVKNRIARLRNQYGQNMKNPYG